MAVCERCKGTQTIDCPNCSGKGIEKNGFAEFLRMVFQNLKLSERTSLPGFESCGTCLGSGVVPCPVCKT